MNAGDLYALMRAATCPRCHNPLASYERDICCPQCGGCTTCCRHLEGNPLETGRIGHVPTSWQLR